MKKLIIAVKKKGRISTKLSTRFSEDPGNHEVYGLNL